MGGRGSWSIGAVDGMAPKARWTDFERQVIGGRAVGSVLDEAEEAGAITYEQDRQSKNLERDLFAHAALYMDGREFTVLKEVTSNETGKKGGSNVDLLMHDGVYWEIKSPTSTGNGKDPLHFVQRRLEEAEHNFRNDSRVSPNSVRVIFNGRHTTVSDVLIRKRLVDELAGHPNIREVLFVHKSGKVEPLP